jgi:hypothetical protein
LECLEDRSLPSNIVWTNRGDDNFGSLVTVGSTFSIAKARQVVDTAISYWSEVIQDFHWDDPDITQFDLTIEVGNLEDGTRASTTGDHDDGDDTPFAATITLDTDAGGVGWWIDGTPRDNSEFLDDIAERDLAFGSFPGSDMLTIVMHEIGHAVGFSETADGAEADDLKIGEYLTDTGVDDPRGTGANLEVFAGSTAAGSLRVAFTDEGGLHINEDNIPYDGKTYFGANDLMNSGRNIPNNSRYLISDLDARILEAAYGYSIKLPSTILGLSYLANRNANGLTILNDPDDFGDDYYLGRDGDKPLASVNGTVIGVLNSSNTTVTSTDPYGEVDIDFSGGPFTTYIDINATGIGDVIRLHGATYYNLDGERLTVRVKIGASTYSSYLNLSGVEQLVIDTGSRNSQVTIDNAPASLKNLTINGGIGNDQIIIKQISAGMSLAVNGDAGNDSIRIHAVPSGATAIVHGGAGSDTIVIGNSVNSLSSVLGDLFAFGDEGTGDVLVLKDYGTIAPMNYKVTSEGMSRTSMGKIKWAFSAGNPSGFESIGLQGGRGNDTARIEGRPPDATMTIGLGLGNDTIVGSDTDGGLLPNFWTMTGVNKGTFNGLTFTAENVQGGAAKDLFTLKPGTRVTGKIDGGAGTDALDYSAFTTAVYANLWMGIATGAGAGIFGIEQVVGGAGSDILVGNSVVNVLNGMAGRDILIGGLGADVLKGGDGDDILIGGLISYNGNPTALNYLRNNWKTAYLNYATRVTRIRNGVGPLGKYKLTTGTVGNDPTADSMTGDLGQDWYWGDLSEINDKAANESVGMS